MSRDSERQTTETRRVLIAEDERPLRELIKRFLADSHFAIIEAENGKAALAAVPDACTIDLLITDVMMPEMDGPELARRMQEQNPDLKVLYLTGHADRFLENEDQMSELETYLDKPFTKKALNDAVSLLLTGNTNFEV